MIKILNRFYVNPDDLMLTDLANKVSTLLALPPLKNFILPGGDMTASFIHVSRTACRRAERRSSEIYVREGHYQNVLIYLNRLSDLLFVWSRWVNLQKNQTETIWKKENV